MGKIQEWYDAWLIERANEARENKRNSKKPEDEAPKVRFPSDIVKELRAQAMQCEDSERDFATGLSTWPKESTLEWAAADLIQSHKREIDHYELMREDFRSLWFDIRAAFQDLGIVDD